MLPTGGQREKSLFTLPHAPQARHSQQIASPADQRVERPTQRIRQERFVLALLSVAIRRRGVPGGSVGALRVIVEPMMVANVSQVVRLNRLTDVDRIQDRDQRVEA